MLNSGQLQLNLYNSSTAFSSGLTSVGVLNVDNTGKVFVGAGGGVSSVGATLPITSSGGSTPNISTSMATNKLIGRGTAGAGPMEEITLGTNLSLSGTTLNATGGIPHGTASGTDTYTVNITGVIGYNDGDAYLIRFTNGNTTGSTLEINPALSLGAKDLYRNNDGLLIGGDIWDGAEMLCIYNSTINGFQCIGTSPNSLFSYVTNDEPSLTLTKGMPVYAYSGTGDRLTVKAAYNTTDATSAQTIGLVASSSIAPNQKGIIIMQGLLTGLSILPKPPFGPWQDGYPVYLGATAGSITDTKPYAPNHLVYLGFVTTANNGTAGRMYVRVQNGYELDELHNVQAQSPTVNDVLYYFGGSPGQWKTAQASTLLPASFSKGSCGVTFDGGSGTITNGKTAYVQIPYNGTLTGWTLVANTGGSCTVTPFKSTYMLFPPTSPGGNLYSVQPSITAPNQKNQNLSPTYLGSQATVTAGDYIGFTISGVTTVTWVNLTISITKT
jgi:hypothetical protein